MNKEIESHLFVKENITLHSGEESDFKIECDALTDADLECIAYLISKKYEIYRVWGVPTGGSRLGAKLLKYVTDDPKNHTLIIDDVLTTGNSMEKTRKQIIETHGIKNIKGVVIFARNPCPDWITPVFQLWQQIKKTIPGYKDDLLF